MRNLRLAVPFLVVAAVTVWLFYTRTMVPLKMRHDEFEHRREQLADQLDAARAKFVAIKQAEMKLGAARGALNRFLGDETDESAMVVFPAQIEEYFSRFGLRNVMVRLATARKEPDLPNYQRIYWSIGVSIPKTDRTAEGLLLAVSELEMQSRFIKVIDFSLQPDAEKDGLRTATVSLMILARKQ